jgi:hypothetical protein
VPRPASYFRVCRGSFCPLMKATPNPRLQTRVSMRRKAQLPSLCTDTSTLWILLWVCQYKSYVLVSRERLPGFMAVTQRDDSQYFNPQLETFFKSVELRKHKTRRKLGLSNTDTHSWKDANPHPHKTASTTLKPQKCFELVKGSDAWIIPLTSDL